MLKDKISKKLPFLVHFVAGLIQVSPNNLEFLTTVHSGVWNSFFFSKSMLPHIPWTFPW